MSAKFQTHELVLPATSAGQRFDQALAAMLPQYSRAALQRWIRSGAAQATGRTLRASSRVMGGEAVTVAAEHAADDSVRAEDIPLAIVHADDSLIVVNKPAGLVVHPGAGNRNHTLQNALLAYDAALAQVPRAGLIHRLDKDTSGLLIVARTRQMHLRLTAAMQARDIHREYLALCTGVLTGGGTVDQPIGRHRTQRTRMAVRRDGRMAITHYRVLERFRAHTLLRVQLETGRTHQIRVHLAHLGFPVVGDRLYAGRRRAIAGASAQVATLLGEFGRQALHAARLEFAHPHTGLELQLEAPPPDDLQRLLKALRHETRGHAR